MNILALDTSGPACSVAVLRDGKLAYEARVVNQKTHSRSLMPMVREALERAGLEAKDVSLVSAVVGPGSFTGVRIAVSAAQGMARGLGVPCLPVNALEAMAASCQLGDGEVVCPIRDARGGQVYGAAFRGGIRLIQDAALPLAEFLAMVEPLGERLYFLGDGVAPSKAAIGRAFGARARFAPAHGILPGAAAAALIAHLHPERAVAPGELLPVYLRAPQAERARAQSNGRD